MPSNPENFYTSGPYKGQYTGQNQDRQEFKVVGQRGIPGRQAYVKATGQAVFPVDIVLPGMLFGKALRSPYAHATIKSLDTSKAEKLPGVRAVVRWDDPEVKALGLLAMVPPPPVIDDQADYEGQEVGVAIAADSEEICDQALALVEVEWNVLPYYLDVMDALKPEATLLQPKTNAKNNVDHETNWEFGNVADGFAKAEKIIEFDYSFPSTINQFSNPCAGVSFWSLDPSGNEGETLTVPCPDYAQSLGDLTNVMKAFKLTRDKVHSITLNWGGKWCGFGAERSPVLAALLAKKTGKPVRVLLNRRENFYCGSPGSRNHVKIGFNKDGMLVAAYGHIVHDAGARGSSPHDSSMNCFTSTQCPNVKQTLQCVYTSTFQGVGGPSMGRQGYWPLAKALYLIADDLGMDPTDVALKNCHEDVHGTYPNPSLTQCIANGKQAINWQWHAPGTKKLPDGRMHGYGFRYHHAATSGGVIYTAAVTIRDDGKVYMPYSETDVGSYWMDAVAMVIAEEVGAKIEDVIVHFVPNLPLWFEGTSRDHGATTTWVAKEAACDVKAKLLAKAATQLKVKVEELDTKDSTVYLKADPSKSYPFKQFASGPASLTATYTGRPPSSGEDSATMPKPIATMNAIFCEVAVDTETGQVEMLDWVAACDAGKMIRPSSYEGQIEGPLTFTTGTSLFEDLVWDPNSGVLLTGSTLMSKPPTRLDVPPIIMPTVESRLAAGCYGATGQSHSVMDKVSLSLAVYNAIGKWIDTPITPDKVLATLGKAPETPNTVVKNAAFPT